ncbi:hypothetical protein [Streptomyces sp. SM12]|uniref:hypothetical protein n=1 Tax=Streptomyces sp. SM12 TaxID=1071602 RepID=UPI0011B07D28|nr:hypothetical protein [Streptomyces sp. SM12]
MGLTADVRQALNRRRDLTQELESQRPDFDRALEKALLDGAPQSEIAEESGMTVVTVRRAARKLGLPDGRLSGDRVATPGLYLAAEPDLDAPDAPTLLTGVARRLIGVSPPTTEPRQMLRWIEANARLPEGHYLGVARENATGERPWGVWPDQERAETSGT